MFDKLFNNSTIQSIILTITAVTGFVSTFLVWLGCKADAIGNLTCNVNELPTWLPPTLAPWVIGTASALAVVGLIIRKVQGILTTPVAPISSSGAPGTVTQKQVDSKSVPDAPVKTVV